MQGYPTYAEPTAIPQAAGPRLVPQGRVHSTESFGSADGPGVRFVVFMQGCHMRCRFCHNPDTWEEVGGTLWEASDLVDRAERYRAYWGDRGGITVSGGEPLLQLDFVSALFREAKARGISTCLDTSLEPFSLEPGWLARFDRLMGSCDLVLADVKAADPKAHRWLTGRPSGSIADGLRHLADLGVPAWVRHVLVPSVTDDEADLRAIRALVDTLPNVERVEVLPYHTLGVHKWERLGYRYPLDGVMPPSSEEVRRAEEILCGEDR